MVVPRGKDLEGVPGLEEADQTFWKEPLFPLLAAKCWL